MITHKRFIYISITWLFVYFFFINSSFEMLGFAHPDTLGGAIIAAFAPLVCIGGLLVAQYTKEAIKLNRYALLQQNKQHQEQIDHLTKQIDQTNNQIQHDRKALLHSRQLSQKWTPTVGHIS